MISEEWTLIEDGRKYKRHDGWLIVQDISGKIHAVPPDKSEALDESGNGRAFDTIAAAIDFVDQHHPSSPTQGPGEFAARRNPEI